MGTYRKIARVAALVAQLLLPQPDEVAMPHQEVGGAMDEVGLVHVHSDEVVKVVLGRRELGVDRRELPQALDGADVVSPLRLGEVVPGEAQSACCSQKEGTKSPEEKGGMSTKHGKTYQSRRMATLPRWQPLPRPSSAFSSSFSLTCSCSVARMSRGSSVGARVSRGSSVGDWADVRLAPRRRAAPRLKRIVMF